MTANKNDKILIIDSKNYPDQNSNDLTILLDEELKNVECLRIIYAGIPCTFYNISKERKNNTFLFSNKDNPSSNKKDDDWKPIVLSDGFYDVKSFVSEFQFQLEQNKIHRLAVRFDVQESTGKIVIKFGKGRIKYTLVLTRETADLLGISPPFYLTDDGKVIIGDKPINFKPFDYFHIHCDIIKTDNILYNGKRSDILVRLPVKNCDFGETNHHYLTGLRDRCCDNSFNKLRILVTDEHNKPIDFNGADIQYELLIRFSSE